MSQEDPTLFYSIKKGIHRWCRDYCKHINNLGSYTIKVVGSDEAAENTEKWLSQTKIKYNLIYDETRPTTIKKDFNLGKNTARVNELRQHSIDKNIIKKFEACIGLIRNKI